MHPFSTFGRASAPTWTASSRATSIARSKRRGGQGWETHSKPTPSEEEQTRWVFPNVIQARFPGLYPPLSWLLFTAVFLSRSRGRGIRSLLLLDLGQLWQRVPQPRVSFQEALLLLLRLRLVPGEEDQVGDEIENTRMNKGHICQ